MPTNTFTLQPIGSSVPGSATDLPNPFRGGFKSYEHGPPDPTNWPWTDVYQRLHWNAIETSQGVYDWTRVHELISEVTPRKGIVGVAFPTYYPADAGGSFLPAYMQNDTYAVLAPTGIWTPRLSSQAYRDRLAALLESFRANFDANPAVGYLDMRITGDYGEGGDWFTWGTGECNGRPAVDIQAVVDVYLNAGFTNIRLLSMTDCAIAVQYALSRSARVGWRRDSMGHADHWGAGLLGLLGGVGDRWTTAPCVGEHWGDVDQTDTLAETRQFHLAALALHSYSGTATDTWIRSMQESGYRYGIASITYPDTVTAGTPVPITASWKNDGLTPTYTGWNVDYLLRSPNATHTGAIVATLQSTYDLQGHIAVGGGTQTSQENLALPPTIPAGTYDLCVAVNDRRSYFDPMYLTNSGRTSDGSYYLGSVTVGVVTPTAISVSPTTLMAGSAALVSGTGFAASETVSVLIDTTQIGSFTASAAGSMSGTVTIPAATLAGSHTITGRGVTTGKSATVPITVTPGTVQCPAGSHWDATRGACIADNPPVCPTGTTWDGTACIWTGAPTCPGGSQWVGPPTNACIVLTPPQCPSGSLWDATSGRCVAASAPVCPPGSSWDAVTGLCIATAAPTCPAGSTWSPDALSCLWSAPPTCPPNSAWDSIAQACIWTGKIHPPKGAHFDATLGVYVADATPTCPAGSVWNTFTAVCEWATVPVCAPGSHWDDTAGACVADAAPICPTGSLWNPSTGRCESSTDPSCQPGSHWDAGLGACVADGVPLCPQGSSWDAVTGRCLAVMAPLCPANSHWDPAHSGCVWDGTPTCPPGTVWDSVHQTCNYSGDPTCPPGTTWNPATGMCVGSAAATNNTTIALVLAGLLGAAGVVASTLR